MATKKRKRTTAAPKKRAFRWPRKRQQEFKPDAKASLWLKTLRLTRLQRLRLSKWLLYALTIVLCLVVQDVVMSQFSLFGATTNLAVAAIFLITVIEGIEVGSIFVLIASTLYYFSGTCPGAYSIALLTFLGVAAAMFRQMYWHRSKGSIVLCAAIAMMLYEMGLFAVGIFNELTIWSRFGVFLIAGLLSSAAQIPLYPLIHKIGLIGGNTWKE